MSPLQSFLASPLAGAVGWTLLHSLWEGAVISGVLGAVLIASRSPRARYFAACAAMLAMVVAFGITLVWMMPKTTPSVGALNISVLPAPNVAAVATTPITWEMRLPEIVPWLALFWIVGVLVVSLQRVAGCLSVRKLRRRGVCCAADRWRGELDRLTALLRISRPVNLLESCLAEVPMVLGHFRPLVLLAAGLLAGIPPEQIEAVLLHELAHIRRCDYLVNVVQRFIEGLFFYHPAIWWFSRIVRAERENCCDDIAVSIGGDAHEYAVALAALEQNRSGRPERAVAVTGGNLMKRIRRLLSPKSAGPSAPFLAVLVLIATTTVAVAAWQTETPRHDHSAGKSETPKELSSGYMDFIKGPTQYLITPQERTAFLRLTTDEERQAFIEQFWARRNPNPGNSENEYKEEFYRRVAYTNAHFAAGTPGWRTDRGRVYIMYGPPNEEENHDSGGIYHANPGELPPGCRDAMTTFPFEDWFYHYIPGVGKNVKMEFVDPTKSGKYRLTRNSCEKYIRASKNSAPEARHASAVVTIGARQRLYVGNEPTDIQDLVAAVQEKLAGNPNLPVYVRAYQSVPWGVVMEVMQTLKQAHISNVHIVTTPLQMKGSIVRKSI